MYRVYRQYLYKSKQTDGDCDPPDTKNKKLRVYHGLTGCRELEVNIHEAMHACLWDLDEDAVDETSTDLARYLWRLGYRKVEVDRTTKTKKTK